MGQPCSALDINKIPVSPAPERPGCRCVPNWQCSDSTGGQVTSPEGDLLSLVNVRSNCFDPLEVCCININPTATPPVQNPPPVTNPGEPEECGHLKPTGVQSVLVGFENNQAQFGQYPWMAAVMATGAPGAGRDNVYVSGGSLIHRSVVMTAAHSVKDKQASQLAVRLGEWNFRLPTEPIPHQDIRVQRIAIHSNYVANRLEYDVALLFLERPAEIGLTVGLICLPTPFEDFDGDKCISTGWGKANFETDKYSEIMKALELPAVNHQACQNALRTTRLGPTFTLHQSFMCAGGGGVDTCTGDGGSPLICPRKNDPGHYVQAGIVAWGIGCGQEGLPGVYASISRALDWIGQQLITSYNFDIRTGYAKR
ncbi:hypothetical protein SK128_024245 [Halocaridina rubra]|uniref:Peptidase S1 domain-containing protein n=1 Tax=Halocaridina rubra TaxID=373956 RepID=A0AAN9A3L2_HALRR